MVAVIGFIVLVGGIGHFVTGLVISSSIQLRWVFRCLYA